MDCFSTAIEMLEAMDRRQVSSQELLDLHFKRIERHNPVINALVALNQENARRCSKKADEQRAEGKSNKLLGLPLTIKDCIHFKGLPTTGGLMQRAKQVAQADAPLSSRVRACGAVILGKTNVPPFAHDWQTDNLLFGRTLNPWDCERTPGGSTGGGAAAVAAGLTPLEFGGDLGGSIRIPAAFCGVYGHKTSQTALPATGHFPGRNRPNLALSMEVLGPLARSAPDLELGLDAAAGAEVGEDVAWQLKIPAARHQRLQDFRVAFLPPVDWLPLDEEIGQALERLRRLLERRAKRVEQAQPELLGDLRQQYRVYRAIFAARIAAGRPSQERRREAEQIRSQADPEDIGSLGWADGLEGEAVDYIEWFERREDYRQAFRDFFQQWDLLVTPVNLVNAFPHTADPMPQRLLSINGQKVSYSLQNAFASLASLSGQPATVFPAGLTRSGLPIGLQAIGPYLEDRTPIRFAALLASEWGGFRPPPSFDDQ